MSNREFAAWCYASGQIEVGRLPAPEGVLVIGHGDSEAELKSGLAATARLAYDGETYLVPGVPEAGDETAGVNAAVEFRRRLERHLGRDDHENGLTAGAKALAANETTCPWEVLEDEEVASYRRDARDCVDAYLRHLKARGWSFVRHEEPVAGEV